MGSEPSLTEFVESVCGESRLRVEADLGDGFVRLKSSEAERRQAAQDIRSSEDVLIELLRNARDAGARHIFVATQRSGNSRLMTVLDDGEGIPATQHQTVFEPRVTSKLDTAHMDKWGMHGRGMALYSIAVNAEEALVVASEPQRGTSLVVRTNVERLGEKRDQSTFPHFEVAEGGIYTMRGPKNLVRTAAEFALEHRDLCSVFMGSITEIAATLYAHGCATLTPSDRAFSTQSDDVSLVQRPALAADAESLKKLYDELGLPLSERSARRILDGEVAALPTLMERLEAESFPCRPMKGQQKPGESRPVGLKLADDDIALIQEHIGRLMEELGPRYFLEGSDVPRVRATSDAIRITIPIVKMS